MSMKTIPPEAYTHRDLAEAMQWRESQPEYVKAMTTTPDSLISFYKRALRSQNPNGNDSKMSESFKTDLKNLAEGLKNFETPQPQPASQIHTQQATTTATPQPERPIGSPPQTQVFSENEKSPSFGSQKQPFRTTDILGNNSMPRFMETPQEPTHSTQRPLHSPHQPMTAPVEPTVNKSTSTTESAHSSQDGFDPRTQQMIQEVKSRLNLSSDTEALRVLVQLGFEKLTPILKT